jgi:hypothetical protein
MGAEGEDLRADTSLGDDFWLEPQVAVIAVELRGGSGVNWEDAGNGLESELNLADEECLIIGEPGVLDLNGVDPRSVEGAEIADEDLMGSDQDFAVILGDRRVIDDEIVMGSATDGVGAGFEGVFRGIGGIMDQDEFGRGDVHVEGDVTDVRLERNYKIPMGLEQCVGRQMWMAMRAGGC